MPIENLINLESINFSINKISIIITEIRLLNNLKYLYMCNNQINNIPTNIGNLKNLKSF
jgi:Leucine-rich repeat (LRR) protein